MDHLKIFAIVLITIFYSYSIRAQIKIPSYRIESGVAGAVGKQTPFWLMSNQYGLLTPGKFNSWIKAGFHTQTDSAKKIDYDYGFDLVNRYSNQNEIYIHQGYARLKLWFVNIQAGNMEEKFGNQDSSLSSGGLLWSGNARPMPKVTINVPKYTAVPFTKGYVEFKGGLSHGWFGKQPFVESAYLHHKFVYIQLGGNLPVHAHFGFHDYAQWGGTSQRLGKQPGDLKAYIDVFLARGSEQDTLPNGKIVANRPGNHIGSRNFGLDIDLKNYSISAYWQTIFEDGSGMAWRNIADGLWGVVLKNHKSTLVSKILYEFIHTTNQSGPLNWDAVNQKELGGNDDYFNHGVYNFGWTYNEFTLGTPLITSPILLKGNNSDYVRNNKVIAHHLGLEGTYKYLFYKLLYTYSLNYGTNNYPFDNVKGQQSILLSTHLTSILPWGLDLGITLGVDKGKMYGDNMGIMVSLIKSGYF